MAKQAGLIKLEGKLEDLVFYTLNGKSVVRRKPSISADKRKKDPSFERVRESNREFGGASKLSAWLRHKLITYTKSDPNTFLNNQLTSAFLKMIQQGQGKRGQRVLRWNEDAETLKSLCFTASASAEIYLQGSVVTSVTNSSINFSLNQIALKKFPPGADSYKCSFLILPLPEMSFDTKKYVLIEEDHQAILIAGDLQTIETNYSQELNYLIPETISNNNFLVIQMLQFYQTINAEQYRLQSTPIKIIDILSR